MRLVIGLGLAFIAAGFGPQAAAQPAGISVDGEAMTRACLTPAQSQREMADFSAAERMTIMTCLQREAARQLNAQLPNQVDEITLLHLVTSEGARLTYHARVAIDAAPINAAQRAALVQGTRTYVCSKADMRNTIALGGSYGYVWSDPDKVEIARTVIEGC